MQIKIPDNIKIVGKAYSGYKHESSIKIIPDCISNYCAVQIKSPDHIKIVGKAYSGYKHESSLKIVPDCCVHQLYIHVYK